MKWFDYGPSIDAFSAGKIDANCVVASDAHGRGGPCKGISFIAVLIDYSDGSDMIVGKPGRQLDQGPQGPEGRRPGGPGRAHALIEGSEAATA